MGWVVPVSSFTSKGSNRMAGLKVSYSEMDAAATKLKAKRDSIVTELEDARKLVTSLVAGGFVTEKASGKFDQASEKFTRGAKTTIESLNEMATFLTQTAKALQQVDADIAAKITAG